MYKYIRLTNIYYVIESAPGNIRRKIEEREDFKHVTLFEEMEMGKEELSWARESHELQSEKLKL